MAYINVNDLTGRFGEQEIIQLTDRADPPTGAVDQAVAEKAIADATEIVDGYLGQRYAIPLAPVPGMVAGWVADIALYRLWTSTPPEIVSTNYNSALKMLREAADGRLMLSAAGVAAPAGDSNGTVAWSGPGRRFPPGSLEDY